MKAAAQAQRLPVLVIEDEPAVMAFICAALMRHGYAVCQARSGREGLEMLAGNHFVGIVSDMRTPGGVSGMDVHQWVLANRPELGKKILFTTGDTANEETAKILTKTGVPYLEKPFRVQNLIGMVESVIGKAE